ncbi:MAG: cytochrome C-552 [Nitrospinae bacterium CG11_big_fil_rev_8_21_14_0_20_45_15]|nr:MAG: cytochrome C-552 [Nitrospinae bacterium CG11_big_fil_rev_8_21_14_0_20_45_15]
MKIKSLLFAISTSFYLSACGVEPTLVVPDEYKAGQKAFHKVCGNCHGADALGKNSKAPKLIDEDYLPENFSDKELIEQILNGSEKMPAQKNKVNASEVDEIIKYLRYSQKAAGLTASSESEEKDDPA